jgi:hypothetical protein
MLAARSSRAGPRGGNDIGAEGANLLRQADHDYVTDLVAFDQAQDAEIEQAPRRATGGHGTETDTAGEPGNGKTEAEPPFEAAVAQEMRIDGALDDREAQAQDEKVLELFPEVFGVGFFVVHGWSSEHARGRRARLQRFGKIRAKRNGLRRDKDLTQRAQSRERRGHREKRKIRSLRPKGLSHSSGGPESQGEPGQGARKKKKGESRETATRSGNMIPDWMFIERGIFALRRGPQATWRTYLLLSQRKCGIFLLETKTAVP